MNNIICLTYMQASVSAAGTVSDTGSVMYEYTLGDVSDI